MTVLCAETVWSNRDEAGNIVQGHVKDCRFKAKTMAKMPGEVIWTPLCNMHANTDRWSAYVDMQWRALPVDTPS